MLLNCSSSKDFIWVFRDTLYLRYGWQVIAKYFKPPPWNLILHYARSLATMLTNHNMIFTKSSFTNIGHNGYRKCAMMSLLSLFHFLSLGNPSHFLLAVVISSSANCSNITKSWYYTMWLLGQIIGCIIWHIIFGLNTTSYQARFPFLQAWAWEKVWRWRMCMQCWIFHPHLFFPLLVVCKIKTTRRESFSTLCDSNSRERMTFHNAGVLTLD